MSPEGQVAADANDAQDANANPQAGEANPKPEPKAESSQVGDDAKKQSELKEARKEAAGYRTQLRERETELQKLRDSLKTDEERKSERLKQLELAEATWREKERASNKRVAIALAAAKADTADPEVLAMLLDREALEYDPETGAPYPDSLTTAIESLLASKSYLVKATPAPAPEARSQASSGAGTNLPRKNDTAITRESIERMSYADINRLYNSGELPEALAKGALNKRG